MALVDDEGRIFGILNLFDALILSCILILVASLFLYSKYPLKLKEHREVIFQMYFENIPDAIVQQVFVPGTPLIATYAQEDTAVIIGAKKIPPLNGSSVILVTFNGSLEVDSDGDLLFNGNDVAPANIHAVQVGASYLSGKIWRVDFEHHVENTTVRVMAAQNDVTLLSPGDLVFDIVGNSIGTVINATQEGRQHLLTLALTADVYNGNYFVSETLLQPYASLFFIVGAQQYEGMISTVSP